MSFSIEQVKPKGDRILVKPDKPSEKISTGGIIIPESKKAEYVLGTVVTAGPGRKFLYEKDGVTVESFEATTTKTGERVILPLRVGMYFILEGDQYVILKENEITASV
jgi:co-chaperonin GroES (HSP10)